MTVSAAGCAGEIQQRRERRVGGGHFARIGIPGYCAAWLGGARGSAGRRRDPGEPGVRCSPIHRRALRDPGGRTFGEGEVGRRDVTPAQVVVYAEPLVEPEVAISGKAPTNAPVAKPLSRASPSLVTDSPTR